MANTHEFVTHYRDPEKVTLRRADRRDINRIIKANDERYLNPPNFREAERVAQVFGTTVADLLDDPGYQKNIQAIASGVLPKKLQSRRKGGWDRPAMARWLEKAVTAQPGDARVGALKDLFENMVEYRDHKNMSRHTEVFAEEAAKRILMRMGADILPLQNHGSGTLDIVAVLNGKLIVIESKGGASDLAWAYAQDDLGDWHWVQQGSLVYLRYKLREHAEILQILKTYKDGKYEYLAHKLEHGEADVEYSKVHGDYSRGAIGNRRLGSVTFTRFDLGVSKTGLVQKPPSGSKPRPGRRGNPSMLKADRQAYEQQRQKVPVVGPSPSWSTARRAAAVAAGFSVATMGAAAPANAESLSASEGGIASSSGNSDDGLLSSLKAMATEFQRMLSSFKDQVLNGLNSLVAMVGDAASKVSGLVADIVDSTGAQALIDDAAKVWAEGQDWINLAMLLSPVGTVTAAISAAITAIQQIVAHWDQIRAGFDWVLKNVLTPVAEFFKAAFKVYITPYKVMFDLVMAGFNGMSGVVGGVVSAVMSVVAGIVKAIGEILQKLEVKIEFGPWDYSFGLKSVGDAMVSWASARMADGGLVRGASSAAPGRPSGIQVMAVIDQSVLRAARAEERKIGYAYRPPFLHDGALSRKDIGPGPRTIDLRVPDVDSAFAQIRMLQAQHDMRFNSVGVASSTI